MSGPSQRTSTEVLRHELEHIELQEQEVPVSPAVRSPVVASQYAFLEPPIASPPQRSVSASRVRTSRASARASSRIRFSEDSPDTSRPSWATSRSRKQPPDPQGKPGLYMIESNVALDDTQEKKRWSSQVTPRPGSPLPSSPSGSSSRSPEPSPSRSRYSAYRSFDASPTRPSPSQHTEGFGTNFRGAVVNRAAANETLAFYRDWVARQRERQRRWRTGRTGRLKAGLGRIYKQYIIEGLLRQKPLPPSVDGRHIPIEPGLARRIPLIDERTGKPHMSNFIRSSRYTVWSFLPKQLLFQFSKLANAYFLIIAILQMIPGLSTTGTYTTIAPLIAFVCLSMAKEGWDDYRRYKLDKTENRSEAWVLDPEGTVRPGPEGSGKRLGLMGLKDPNRLVTLEETSELGGMDNSTKREEGLWSRVLWQDLRVGDIIRLRRDDSIPADMILLHATGPNGIAYIETMALDGETNLKSKQSCRLFGEDCNTLAGFHSMNDAVVVSEDPNLDLYNYEGRATVGGETVPLTTSEVVYRGSNLRNTDQAIGLVINTGEECKIRMNASKNVHAKAPAMQGIANKIVLLLVFFVIMLSVGCTIGNEMWKDKYEDSWYIHGAAVPVKEIIIGFIIMFNTLIPLSLYVSLEIIKLGQLLLLQDVDMYDPGTDTPMVANTTTILENLGQVSYVFSDKTGTLTENIMRFRKMSVAGTAWLHDMDLQKEAAEADERKGRTLDRKGKGAPKYRDQASAILGPEEAEVVGLPLIAEQSIDSAQPRKSTTTLSRWKSTVRPAHAQPELKTEELIEYIRRKPHTPFSRKARHFILCIALCHTCLPEMNDKGEISYQAASPDELALVDAARDLGYLVIDRLTQSIQLQFRALNGSTITERYGVLDVIEFSSKRKRMSIIIRMPDGKICIFCKGADSLILPRLKKNQEAAKKASAVEQRATLRKSMEQASALRRLSMQTDPRQSIQMARAAHRKSMQGRKSTSGLKRSLSVGRRRSLATDEVDSWLNRRETEELDRQVGNDEAYQVPRRSLHRQRSYDMYSPAEDPLEGLVDESLAMNDAAIFERCFQHLDDFATEGLRTLLYASRYVDDEEYKKWKATYLEATTSLVNRQERVEAAAELIEQGFDLAGATAIEDKLQHGIPDTIDKLRRANIKVWMLTGDKRETAINIAQSARICKPFSELYVLDATEPELHQKIASTLIDVGRGMIPHSVVVIDGHTLSVVEEDESLRNLFFDLAVRVDSVICCRASPSQKATLVKCVRNRVPKSITLAIGDGANDIAMIQASHVGIGISGREGLQAARISDYSIAQFRFLQRLLFVHGRWNYIRTGKYILGTFWKEIVFYLVQAQYQHFNGYTGTSFFESASLTVFNTLFTSLPVIFLGIFEQDLRAETLLAVPELYTFGQRNKGFSFRLYIGWMIMAAVESLVIFHCIYGVYRSALFTSDTSLYAMGDLAFTICVIFINIKMLLLETHNQTIITFAGIFMSVTGWFIWNIFLAFIYKPLTGPYIVRDAFIQNFGRDAGWWITGILTLTAVVVLELVMASLRRVYWPRDQDLMQELEKDEGIMEVMREHAAERGEATMTGSMEGKPRTSKLADAASIHTLDEMPGEGGAFATGAGNRPTLPPPFTPTVEITRDPMDLLVGPNHDATKDYDAQKKKQPAMWLEAEASSLSPVEWRAPPLPTTGRFSMDERSRSLEKRRGRTT